MNKFRLGIITGMSSMVIAVPILSVAAYAQSSTSTEAAVQAIPSQACVEALANVEQMRLDQFDLMNDKRKEGIKQRVDSLRTAAAITSATDRQAALKQMRETEKALHDTMKEDVSDEIQAAMDAVKTACGDTFKMRMEGFGERHPMIGKMMDKAPAFIAEKLGMTEDELKAAMDGGKTIKEIAEEKGIELPAPPRGRHMMEFFDEEVDQ